MIIARHIRLLLKLATGEEFVGDAQRKTGMYSNVHEDPGTASTHKLPSVVEFTKKSIIFIILIGMYTISSAAYDDRDIPITTDSRIKTYLYSPNEVYLMVLHYGFQSHIEFGKNEKIETLTVGDSYAWKITPLDNRLFIKPLEKNIRTNMTIITNLRTYQFDIVAKELEDGDERDLVYLVRFLYPRKRSS